MPNKVEVYFQLIGNKFEPDEVTSIIGLNPTKIRRETFPVPKHSRWIYSSGEIVEDSIDVYELADNIVFHLKPVTGNIIKAREKFNLDAVLQVVIYFSSDESISTPAIGFEKDVIEFLYNVGATIDIDTYRNY